MANKTLGLKLIITEWIETPGKNLLIISLLSNGTLTPSLGFPTPGRTKSCYFIKKSETPITKDNLKQIILCGDISGNPITDLAIITDTVIAPLLSNPLNRCDWPTAIAEDVNGKLQALLSVITEVKGNFNNETILPVPSNMDEITRIDEEIRSGKQQVLDPALENTLDGLVIKWSYQLNEVLSRMPTPDAAGYQLTPSNEFAFWALRLRNLDNIYKQLRSPNIQTIGNILEAINSVYAASFRLVVQTAVTELNRARDVSVYLNALAPHTDIFRTTDLDKALPLVRPLLHCMCLMWARARQYSGQDWSRLLRMIGNMLVAESINQLDAPSIFQNDVDEEFQRLGAIIIVLEHYKQEVMRAKSELNAYRLPDTFPAQWSLQSSGVFEHLNKHLERLRSVKGIFETAVEFTKLDRIEFGGLRGRNLSQRVSDIAIDYQRLYNQWALVDFDVFAVVGSASGKFIDRRSEYQARSDSLERALAQVFVEAFNDCSTMDHCIKLVEIAGTLLHTVIIKAQVISKFDTIVSFYTTEVTTVQGCLNRAQDEYQRNGVQAIPKDRGWSNVAGALRWIRKLQKRITLPLLDLPYLDFPIFSTDDGEMILSQKDQLLTDLSKLEADILERWCIDISQIIPLNLAKSLLRQEDQKLVLNFDPTLSEILREVRLLKSMGYEGIPEAGVQLYSLSESLWQSRLMLSRVAERYNFVRHQSEPCEFKIIEGQLIRIDNDLKEALDKSTWLDYRSGYIKYIYDNINDLHRRLCKTQANIQEILAHINAWGSHPLYERKHGNARNLLDTDNITKQFSQRAANVTQTKEIIGYAIEENYRLFFDLAMNVTVTDVAAQTEADERAAVKKKKCFEMFLGLGRSVDALEANKIEPKRPIQTARSLLNMMKLTRIVKNSEDLELFVPYEEHVDRLVSAAIMNSVHVSMEYICREITADTDASAAMFEVSLHVEASSFYFRPSLEVGVGLHATITTVIDNIYSTADLIPRIAQRGDSTASTDTYKTHLIEDKEIEGMKTTILLQVYKTIEEVRDFVQVFENYKHIWVTDKTACLEHFSKSGEILSQEQLVALDDGSDLVGQQKPASLDMFKDQIEHWLSTYETIDHDFLDQRTFGGWLRLDMREIKQSLLNECCKWRHIFQQFMLAHLTQSLNELELFIDNGWRTLTELIADDDFDRLLSVMSVVQQIEQRQHNVETVFFETLHEEVAMLRNYSVELDNAITIKFTELPDKWQRLKKRAVTVKEDIAPVQAHQVSLIIGNIRRFERRIDTFRESFKQMPFLYISCKDPYDLCNHIQKEIVRLETQLSNLNKSAVLFRLSAPSAHKLELCRKEIGLVKKLWDFVYVINSCVNDWKRTAWKRLDVEEMEQLCKKYSKDIRALGKSIQQWEPYQHVDRLLRNLLTSLKAITELQNSAIQDRHWIELMQSTGINIRMNKHTTLRELLNLNLHDHEEDVKITVDRAVKEMAMQRTLSDIEAMWQHMHFDFEVHTKSGLRLLRASEELIETLEEHQVQVHNITNSKYIAFFEREFSGWAQRLARAEHVIVTWSEVQRKWMYLESIFIRSEDLRQQLPADSELFDGIDDEFRKVLNCIGDSDGNVIGVTNEEGLAERIEQLLEGLVRCEKALNDYLETKRLAYPRFYFISSTDLLDILSNGNDPEAVGRHLTKLYDSIMRLKYEKGTKVATGMFSKENEEYVAFDAGKCDCSGKVELWLNEVTEAMRRTLRALFSRAVVEYDRKAREQFVFEWPAQVALCITQIWWSIDVNVAFRKQLEGYEMSLKDYQRKQINQLNALIVLLLGDLSAGDRQKIMTICTIDVHSRDIVARIISQKVETATAFQWQSQLRHRWDTELGDCLANICDAEFKYAYEYLGNTPRLVITPLTDRCYITLTQSLHLIMGGAPAGPAGTGKTETTKDLGKGLGIMVYVFNCSEQMDYRSCGSIYKGLAQTGAWGCFDEFNRISIEVLSVVAVQVKCILDAIKREKTMFTFMGEQIALVPTVGLFVTMNPGYAGRTELPENLKALFRPCAMVVPDFALICEIMLVAEGFQEARVLARKFITLYTLCKELLSQQDHYDWGLRAIKSVLVVAGALRRGDRQRPEDQVLMRALRDFNIPKIVTDDVAIFLGLIGDLFPSLDVPRKRSHELERLIKKSAQELKLQAEDGFILKVVQLKELLAVRHSVFIVGSAGTGKTEIWKTLHQTYRNQKLNPHFNDLNPKGLAMQNGLKFVQICLKMRLLGVTNDELFGIINPATREWKDGLFSAIMRDQAVLTDDSPKWIVLDGDIDPMWIESLNTVMDDNKVLTLASNERIALTKEMRLLFEVNDLKFATPATVSRAGILYINATDLGWYPFVASWIESRSSHSEHSTLTFLFDKYVPVLLDGTRKLKRITPITDIAMVQMTCHLLDCLLPVKIPENAAKEWQEIYFVFAIVWGFGATFYQDQIIDWRSEFNRFWANEFKTIRLPGDGNVFNFFIDPVSREFRPWSDLVAKFELDPDVPLQSTLVPTEETVRMRWFLDTLIAQKHPVMLIGGAGSGKSVIVREKLAAMTDSFCVSNIPFNFYTSSDMLQKILEQQLEKKAGRNYAPSGTKFLIYFVDDMNMPEVDNFGTVQPHQIIRQFMDYHHWYDRTKLTLREIQNCQFAACMNPTAGSFRIDPRLQRHFCSFAVSYPSDASLFTIYSSILGQHLAAGWNRFTVPHQRIAPALVNMGLSLHSRLNQTFLPTAVKFHYTFNLRDLANIYQGILFATRDTCPEPEDLARLYVHEAYRVYGDKLVNEADQESFKKLFRELFKKGMEELDDQPVFREPLIYCHFADGLADPKYMPVLKWADLTELLTEAQVGYNEIVGHINLVMFDDAMAHICRINRIIEGPRGNALLIGVGGSGKQSLARLAAYISGLTVTQIQLRRGYGMVDMKADLNALYMKVGVKSIPSMFLMTDAQVVDEAFLVIINDILASGELADLFSDEETETITNAVRNEVKQQGIVDTKANCWKHFVDKVRRMLKIVLCFSPVGSTLRRRARKFPALVNCTSIDWFHEWPRSALESVSKKFLKELDVLPAENTSSVSMFMAYVLGSVNDMSEVYLTNERRHNYTTPKSFLELIALYSKLLREKTAGTLQKIRRLENGLVKLGQCAEQVDSLKHILAEQEIILQAKNEAADNLIVVVSGENETVQKERKIAAAEEQKVRIIEEDVFIKTKLCEEDLRKAEPALLAAQEALNTLNKNNLTELKSFGTPPQAVINVCAAVLVLCSKQKLPKDRSWKACKQLMGAVDRFLNQLLRFDKEHIPPKVIVALQPYLNDPEFDPQKILAKSSAASGLCAWVINIHKFYNVYLIVGPKQKALRDAQQELRAAQEKLDYFNAKIQAIEAQLSAIETEFETAMSDKIKYQAEADKTTFTIDLAHRLVNGLGSEAVRWHQSVDKLRNQITKMPGDVLFIACFVSYAGCFTRRYRLDLLNKMWKPTFLELKPAVPHTKDIDPLDLICDDAQIAAWNNEGLPSDRMSTENAIILMNSSRWPLLIDPQLQGVKWIKQKYGHALIVTNLEHKGYLDVIERAVACGDIVLLENINESVDAVLNSLLSRALIKKGRAIKIGDKEVDFHPQFRLILQTKLANPHYKPEMQAQTTLINFTVTRDGLEDQLLAEVVKAERPDLEQLKSDLTVQQNSFKISLKQLEDDLLERLSSSGDDVLDDPSLVINLESTKRTAAEIENKVLEARITSVRIDTAREQYRAAAERSSILYFILNDLFKINRMYQFSLKAFVVVFKRAIAATKLSNVLNERVQALVDAITYAVFMYTCRGLFEKDKLVFMTQMVIQILMHRNEVSAGELDFLFRFPTHSPALVSPLDFLSSRLWGSVRMLSLLDAFRGIDKDLEVSSKRWRQFIESETPEREKLPGDWRHRSPFQRLCIVRTLRPDRVTYASWCFVEEIMGSRYIESRMIPFSESFGEMSASTPIFFILSPGVDPLMDVERLGRHLCYTTDADNFHNVSLGQGQELVAESAIDVASQRGHWVILQNVHLVARWLPRLEKKIEGISSEAHSNFRLFISAEPAPCADYHIIPQGILESAIKITNEPPTGMQANLHKALDNFSQETLEMCTKEAEFKAILFALCYFHAVVAERRKFGSQGWNIVYPFNIGDLTISVYVLYNYLEGNKRVPWEDLRYLFGEIMYGGHITDDWDRRLCRTYLEELMQPDLVDGDLCLCRGFEAPSNSDYAGYHQYITESLPAESPHLYGMHPNSELGFLTNASDELLRTIFELQPRKSMDVKDGVATHEESVKQIIDEIQDKLPDEFCVAEIMTRVEFRTPFIVVAIQECERMNGLMSEMRRSLRELRLGLKGELSVTVEMEQLDACLLYDRVPANWTKLAYPSLLGLQAWFVNLMLRYRELDVWVQDFCLPSCVWLAGFFNPQSFLTAIMQTTARKNRWPLDRMCLNVDVTGKVKSDFSAPPKDGAYIHGLYMEGARWDTVNNAIGVARIKELFPLMPVLCVKATTQDKQEIKNVYQCPVYRTRTRGSTYIWTFNLRSKEKPSKWILGGVALLLQT